MLEEKKEGTPDQASPSFLPPIRGASPTPDKENPLENLVVEDDKG